MLRPDGGPHAGRRTRALLLLLVLAALCVWAGRGLWGGAHAQTVVADAVAAVVRVEGTCMRLPAKSAEWVSVGVGCLIHPGDRVRCGPDSWAVLGLANGGSVTLGPGCEVRFDSLLYLRLFIGRLWAKVKPAAAPGAAGFSIETPSAVVGVRGTHFSVWVHDELSTTVSVASGAVKVFGNGVAVLVPEGYATRVKRGRAPEKPEPMDDDEKRAWAERWERFKEGDEGNDEKAGGDGGGKAGKQGPDGGKPPGPDGRPGGEPPGDDGPGGDAEDGLASDGGDAGRHDGGDG